MAINAVIRFLQAARSMAQRGMKKEQILDFARREFGEVSKLLKKQIDDIFKAKPKTEKKGGIVDIKTRKEYKKELDEALGPADDVFGSPIKDQKMKEFDKAAAKDVTPKGEVNPVTDQMPDQQRKFLGFPNRNVEAIVRAAAREILNKNPEISRILTEKKIYNFKPRQGLDIKQKGEIEDITAFDPEGRDPNADGGLINILKL